MIGVMWSITVLCPATINCDARAYHYGDAQDAVKSSYN